MATPHSNESRSATAIRFPPDVHDRLRQAAEERGLSINYLINYAVREMLDNLLPPEQIRLTRRNDKDAR